MKYFATAVVALVLVMLSTSAASASSITISLDTAGLASAPGASAGPFSLAFQFVQGSEAANNSVSLGSFAFGVGGSAASGCPAPLDPCTFGSVAGDLSTGLVLDDTSSFSAYVQMFNPSAGLSFGLILTTNVDAGGIPDAFALSILDSDGNSIPTLDPSGADTILTIFIDGPNPTILPFATDPSRATNAGLGPAITLDAPTIGTPAPTVPEPISGVLLLTGLVPLLRRGRARQPRAPAP